AEERRFKLRRCARVRRARAIERWLGALGRIPPRVVARAGALLLLEALDEHRPLEREELLARVSELGAMVAQVHAAAERAGVPGRFARVLATVRSRFQIARDLTALRHAQTLKPEIQRAAEEGIAAGRARFGLPVALELDDLHKANLMLRERDGDLRFVDEEGVAVRPLLTSLASLVKTADRQAHWQEFRDGYEAVRDPSLITPEYTGYVVLIDTIRKVANKVRAADALDSERREKLPAEIDDLERVVSQERAGLDWGFHRGG
ncbi:MAG: hypothetical protein ACR2PQ_10085, partial [Myxococcota bacterium]